MIKVIAFDVFGTVFDLSSVPREEIKAYIDHIKQPEWSPLKLPKSWEWLDAHADAAKGIEMLRSKYTVVTCSNGPLGLLTKLSKFNSISWDAIIPLELSKAFKPKPEAYMTVCNVLDVRPEEVMMVTANEKFGDLEAAGALGMMPMLIRNDEFKTIIDLANWSLGTDDLQAKLKQK